MGLSVLLIALFLYFSNRLIRQLGEEERVKMEIWADAYRQLVMADPEADMTLEMKIIQSNTTIPVFYTDGDGVLQGANNLVIPEDTAAFIDEEIKRLRAAGSYFEINLNEVMGIEPDEGEEPWMQYLYYEESLLLQQLHYYPYIQLAVIIVFLLLLYYMLMAYKRAEQNQVWVGLSKETAHQLGTPIQSLLGWMEYLETLEQKEISDAVTEMDKDVQRLRIVADRFSKIGSEPQLEETDLCELVGGVIQYMQKRTSKHVTIDVVLPDQPVVRRVCPPLFAWVIENLCRNAIDAMKEGRGYIRVRLNETDASIEVEDNGKGIPKSRWKSIFQAGYTTKKRGWGLGLTLVKRIIEEYHHGRIFVKASTPGLGTTFRIEL